MIHVERLSCTFRGVRALEEFSLDVGRGEIVGIAGPDGSGKSTLLDVLSGFARPSSGYATVGGLAAGRASVAAVAACGVARTFAPSRLFSSMTVLENVVLAAHRHAEDRFWLTALAPPIAGRRRADVRRRAHDALIDVSLDDRAHALARELDDAARRRLTIACAMVSEPIAMLLDEPFGAMPRGAADSLRKVLAQFVRRCNVATIVAERDPVTCAGLCDRIIVLHAGRTIAEGSFAALKSNEDVLDAYVGVEWRQ